MYSEAVKNPKIIVNAIHIIAENLLFSLNAIHIEKIVNPTYRSIKDIIPHGLDRSSPPSIKKSPFINPLARPAVIANKQIHAIILPIFILNILSLNILYRIYYPKE